MQEYVRNKEKRGRRDDSRLMKASETMSTLNVSVLHLEMKSISVDR